MLSRHGATNVFTTPTAMRSMMAIADAGTRYPQQFRIVCSAGEPLNPEAIRWFREQYGLTVLDYYGLTESYPLVANYPFLEVREGSMGKPMPGWDVQILDEDERPVAVGERGEICLRARSNPHYPLGYWNNDEAGAETFGGDWFHTKDAARTDEDGYVWYEGRADDVIIAAGYRIGPFEVESACLEHPAVAEAAAVASPDERRGNVVKAFIVCAADVEPSDELADEIKAFVRGRLGAHAYPRRIEFTDAPAQDADRQDPPDRAAPARAGRLSAAARRAILGGVEASATPTLAGRRRCCRRRSPGWAASPRWRCSARCSGSGWSRGSPRAARCSGCSSRSPPRPRCCGPTALRRLRAAGDARGRPARAARRVRELRASRSCCSSRAGSTSSARACRTAPRRSRACRCRTRAPTRGRATTLQLLGALLCVAAALLAFWPRASGFVRGPGTRAAATRSSRSPCC